jgi:hypothetical protein
VNRQLHLAYKVRLMPELPERQIHSALGCLQKQTPKVQVMKPVPHLLQLWSMQKVRGQK